MFITPEVIEEQQLAIDVSLPTTVFHFRTVTEGPDRNQVTGGHTTVTVNYLGSRRKVFPYPTTVEQIIEQEIESGAFLTWPRA
jgi:hypothetical protein